MNPMTNIKTRYFLNQGVTDIKAPYTTYDYTPSDVTSSSDVSSAQKSSFTKYLPLIGGAVILITAVILLKPENK